MVKHLPPASSSRGTRNRCQKSRKLQQRETKGQVLGWGHARAGQRDTGDPSGRRVGTGLGMGEGTAGPRGERDKDTCVPWDG